MSKPIEPPASADLAKLVRWAGTKLTVSLGMSLYFKPPPSSCAEGVLRVYERYLELCEPHLTWFADETGKKYRPAAPDVLRIPFRRVPEALDHDKFYSWGSFAGKHHRDASPYQFHAVLSPDEHNTGKLSMVRAAFPVPNSRAETAGFVKLVQELTSLAPVFHGYAGFSFSESLERGARQTNEPYLVAAAMRFSGIEVEDQTGTRLCCQQAIKGVNWLTLMEKSFVKRLGGEKALRAQLGEGIDLHPMPWGLMIQAGPEPGIGDVNAGEQLPHYRQVHRALRPVRVAVHMPFGVEFDEIRTLKWMGRFD